MSFNDHFLSQTLNLIEKETLLRSTKLLLNFTIEKKI